MGFLMLLLPITSLVAFVGYVWLVRNAFRSSTGWGVAVLLLSPFSAVFFAIKNWEEARKPFLIYSGSSAAGLVVLVMVFASMGGFEAVALANDVRKGGGLTEEQAAGFITGQMDRMEASGMLDEQEQATLEQMRQAMAEMTGEQDADEALAATDSSIGAPPPRPRISDPEELSNPAVVEALRLRAQETARENRLNPAGPIRVADADRYVGRRMTVMGTDGIEHSGILSEASGKVLWLEQHFSGGTFAVELRKSQIRSLEVLETR